MLSFGKVKEYSMTPPPPNTPERLGGSTIAEGALGVAGIRGGG